MSKRIFVAVIMDTTDFDFVKFVRVSKTHSGALSVSVLAEHWDSDAPGVWREMFQSF